MCGERWCAREGESECGSGDVGLCGCTKIQGDVGWCLRWFPSIADMLAMVRTCLGCTKTLSWSTFDFLKFGWTLV